MEYDVRLCDHKVDLYVLQPDKLNSSGQNNPLKGKLTNCHYTGCERWGCEISAAVRVIITHCFVGLLACKRCHTVI